MSEHAILGHIPPLCGEEHRIRADSPLAPGTAARLRPVETCETCETCKTQSLSSTMRADMQFGPGPRP
jgi:hypothetical protein